MRYRLRADGPYPVTADYLAVGIQVHNDDGGLLHTYAVILSFEKETILAHRFGRAFDPSAVNPELNDALFRWGVRRVEAILAGGSPAWDPAVPSTRLVIGEEDFADVARAWGPKHCDLQLQQPRRLICTAAIQNDPSALSTEGLITYAPTSDSLCRGCSLPDSTYVCAHLINPEVTSVVTDQQGVVRRSLIGAMCQLGRDEIERPEHCHAGGHACCERIMATEGPLSEQSPLSIHATIDYANAAWRASSLSGHQHLFRHRSAEILGDLTQPCTTRAEFRDRVSELDNVFKSIEAPADDPSFSDAVRAAGPLVRMKHLLVAKLEAIPDPTAAGGVREDFGRLIAVSKIRTAIQHVETRDVDLPTALAFFGIAYPPSDWGLAWGRVSAAVVASLASVAQTLADL